MQISDYICVSPACVIPTIIMDVVGRVLQWLQTSNNSLFLCLVIIAFLTYYFLPWPPTNYTRTHLPPGPPAWPVVGNLHLLVAGKVLPHRKFAQLAHQYGPIFFLHLGSKPAVVVSSPTLAKAFLHGPYDQMFANRPHNEVGSRAFYPEVPLLMQYGPSYTVMRKFLILELAKIQARPHVRMEEISLALLDIQNQSGGGRLPVDVTKIVGQLQLNFITLIVLSRKVTESDMGNNSLLKIMKEMIDLLGFPTVGDYIPCMRFLDVQVKHRSDCLHELIDSYLDNIIAERRLKQLSTNKLASIDEGAATNDILDALLANKEFSDTQIKAATVAMIAAGMDTSSATVDWAMAELLRNPIVFQKLQDEINFMITDKQNLVTESDIAKLSYLHAVIKETFRLHPILPMLFPHMTHQACEIGGYFLPKNTRAFVNVWAIGHSSSVWDNPEEFRPERFIGNNIDPRGRHFELLPFGAGRRMCAGMALGMTMVELILANLVHSFRWELPAPLTPKDVDMGESGELVMRRREPLVLLPKLLLAKLPTTTHNEKA